MTQKFEYIIDLCAKFQTFSSLLCILYFLGYPGSFLYKHLYSHTKERYVTDLVHGKCKTIFIYQTSGNNLISIFSYAPRQSLDVLQEQLERCLQLHITNSPQNSITKIKNDNHVSEIPYQPIAVYKTILQLR